ncbi:hypothetical protein JTE90_002799 [Oedothorax gibbosus]|uniref:Uncharacterized protein n=1 Tax=Oedothorax gibbosus TaxID=931172 RepID=A0AAV6TU33_9ARAC|nr:hypothetical protein JTE90_002799 [Oedothorax gibbosus]
MPLSGLLFNIIIDPLVRGIRHQMSSSPSLTSCHPSIGDWDLPSTLRSAGPSISQAPPPAPRPPDHHLSHR